MPSGPLVEQRTAPRQFVVPAQGYVYSFHIRATFAWSSTVSLRAEVLTWYADYFMPQAIQRLTRLAADAARELAPHRAADLEMHLQQALAAQGPWRYQRGDLEVSCTPDVAVRLDEHIRRAVQPQIDRLVNLECRLEEHLQQARYAEELSRRWVVILDDHLAVAGGDPDLATARQHMLSRQRDALRSMTSCWPSARSVKATQRAIGCRVFVILDALIGMQTSKCEGWAALSAQRPKNNSRTGGLMRRTWLFFRKSPLVAVLGAGIAFTLAVLGQALVGQLGQNVADKATTQSTWLTVVLIFILIVAIAILASLRGSVRS